MPDLIPVAHDPFNDPPTNLIPVDHDPWAVAQTHAAEVPNPVAAPLRQFGSQLMDRLIDPLQVRAGVQTAGNMAGNLLDLSTEALRPTSYSDYDPRNALAAATTDMGLNLIGGGAPAAERGALGMAGGKPITAYHGSPHDFDAFDLSRIGTGEGAQAYGRGLYFAENPATAQAYRDALTADQGVPAIEINGERVHPDELYGAEQLAARAAQKYSGESGWRDFINGNARSDDEAMSALELLQRGDIKAAPAGRMYEVNINADPERFLDWDAPLSEQPTNVQDLVRKVNPDLETVKPFFGDTGAGVHKALENHFFAKEIEGRNPQTITRDEVGQISSRVTQKLNELGIPGIKYLDQGSRGAGNGTRNYVVFSDKILDIVRKYGLAGLIAGGASHFSLTPTDHDPFAQ